MELYVGLKGYDEFLVEVNGFVVQSFHDSHKICDSGSILDSGVAKAVVVSIVSVLTPLLT